MKKFLYITGCSFSIWVNAQQPFINSLDKTSGTANEIVTISGIGFSDPATPIVYFGNGKASSIVSSSANVIEVRVPATATYGPVIVVNTNGELTASSQPFTLSFDNDAGAVNTFTRDAIVTQSVTDLQPYDVCLCDFDNDGQLDAAMTSLGSDNIKIAVSGGTSASPTMTLSDISSTPDLTNKTANVTCGDLNNDGLPDLVATSIVAGEPFVHVFENDGGLAFTKTRLNLPTHNGSNRQGKKIRIADIDGDGKPDLIVGSQKTDDNNVLIFLNTSSGSVSFSSSPVLVSVEGASNTGGLDVGDFDNDGKPDLVVVPFRQVDVVYLLRNISFPGTVSFTLKTATGGSSERANVEIGDFDKDGFNDLAISRTSGLEIFQNNGGFSFTPLNLPSLLLSGVTAWGLDLGDINGDGLADVIISSIEGDQIIYYENTTSGTINFSVADQITTEGPARNVRIGDLNADGKPDIVVADDSQSGQAGAFSFIINRNRMTPVIAPSSGNYCSGGDFILRTTGGEGVSYSWIITGGMGTTPVNASTLNLSGYTGSLSITVTATPPDGMGSEISSPASVFTQNAGLVPGTPIIDDPGLGCIGSTLTLTSSSLGFSNYLWSGPNDFTQTTSTPSIVVTDSITSVHAGTYTLVVDNGTCPSPETTRLISVSGPPVTAIEVTGCDDGSIGLEVSDFSSQFGYQWKLGTSNVGTDSPTYTATTSGTYTLDITDVNMCTYTTNPLVIPNAPNSNFTNPIFGGVETNEMCIDVLANFNAVSTGASGLTLGYTWEVEDPSGTITSSDGIALAFTFTSLGDWKVRLLTEYTDGFGCNVIEKTITVSSDPAFSITPSASTKCSTDAVTLTLTGADTNSGDTWTWDDDNPATDLSGEISNVLLTSIPATYTATYISGTGCETTTMSITIDDFSGIGVTATESTIVNDTIIFDDEQISVTLTATNSLGFTWVVSSNQQDLNNSDTDKVVVTPSAPIVTVTVSGQTLDGCTESTDIVIISNSFIARDSFSPNGDGLNDFWTINNSRNLNGCTVFIFDSRGATILREDSPFVDDRVWDGNHKGKPATEGIYYFVLKCDDSADQQTGSILLAR